MSFDISSAIGEMAGAMQASVAEDAGDIAQFAQRVLMNQKDSLAELAQARLDGDLDEEEFTDELKREMLVTETELLALTVMGKAAIQKAIQAATSVLLSLVKL